MRSKMRDIICGPEADVTYVGVCVYRVMVLTTEVEQVQGRKHARNGQLNYAYGPYIVTNSVENYTFMNISLCSTSRSYPRTIGKSWTERYRQPPMSS
jgi:salicylate hydroxylase